MSGGRFDTIATRLAFAIVLAMVLAIALEMLVGFGKAYLASAPGAKAVVSPRGVYVFNGYRQPRFVINLSGQPDLLVRVGKIAAAASFIDAVTEADRARIVSQLNRPGFRLAIRDLPLSGLDSGDRLNLSLLRKLVALELETSEDRVEIGVRKLDADSSIKGKAIATSEARDALVVQIGLRDGHWLLVTIPDYVPRHISPRDVAATLIPLMLLVGLLAVWQARRLAAPIEEFSRAAERLGVDASATAPPLPESGPRELRTTIRAFNLMQERLRRFVEDRTQMLAAMSHDLRTPLNRLRLRAEFIEDAEQQRKMFIDLEAMNVMIDSTLAFVRDDAGREERRLVDLGILVEDVCEDATDAGGTVSYSGPLGMNIHCRPIAIGRAITNMVDNAVKYGGGARVRVLHMQERVVIEVEDEGPGIPSDELEKVFVPFYRLERSRNAATGGVGLGLSAARTIAREHGGDISLANRHGGGLSARMELPYFYGTTSAFRQPSVS
jgi:signal transduction histidine kinase